MKHPFSEWLQWDRVNVNSSAQLQRIIAVCAVMIQKHFHTDCLSAPTVARLPPWAQAACLGWPPLVCPTNNPQSYVCPPRGVRARSCAFFFFISVLSSILLLLNPKAPAHHTSTRIRGRQCCQTLWKVLAKTVHLSDTFGYVRGCCLLKAFDINLSACFTFKCLEILCSAG